LTQFGKSLKSDDFIQEIAILWREAASFSGYKKFTGTGYFAELYFWVKVRPS
jgi:hypothetical protein